MEKISITKEIFDRLNERTSNYWDEDSSLGYYTKLHFSGKQIVDFLEKNGYIVTLHTVLGIEKVFQGDNNPYKDVITPIERIVAVKDLNELPEKWEYNSWGGFVFDSYISVFEKLIKNKLLNN